MPRDKYFNFPVILIRDMVQNHKRNVRDIIDYCLFKQGLKSRNMISVYQYYGLEWHKSQAQHFENGEVVHESIRAEVYPHSYPMTGIKVTTFLEYQQDKTEFEIITLLAFLAIKSIIGGKTYYPKLTMDYLYSRMDGQISIVPDNQLSEMIRSYKTEHYYKKIINELQESWNLKYYSYYMRGAYVSFKLDLETLITIREKKRKAYKDKERKLEEAKLRGKVRNRIS